MRAAGVGHVRSTHKDSLRLSPHGTPTSPSTIPQELSLQLCLLRHRSLKELAVSPVLRRLPGSSLRPQGETSPGEYQSIDMGTDSVSEQNTKVASLLSVPRSVAP